MEELKEKEQTEKKKENHKENKNVKKDKNNNLNKLKEELEQAQKDNANLLQKLQYSQAELINYRKRKDEEVANFKKFCNKDLIVELIPVVDNFERAIKHDDNNLNDELSKFLDGFKMMYSQLTEILRRFGVEEISNAGEVFNPQEEEALLTDNVPDIDDGIVLEVLLKGYKLNGKVIRPASVKVNNKN